MGYSFPPLLQHPGYPAGRRLWNLRQARQGCWAGSNLLLTLQRFPVHHPLDGGFGVPIGSTHQPPILARSQDQVLGFIQPVGSSWKTRQAQAGGVRWHGAGSRRQAGSLKEGRSWRPSSRAAPPAPGRISLQWCRPGCEWRAWLHQCRFIYWSSQNSSSKLGLLIRIPEGLLKTHQDILMASGVHLRLPDQIPQGRLEWPRLLEITSIYDVHPRGSIHCLGFVPLHFCCCKIRPFRKGLVFFQGTELW